QRDVSAFEMQLEPARRLAEVAGAVLGARRRSAGSHDKRVRRARVPVAYLRGQVLFDAPFMDGLGSLRLNGNYQSTTRSGWPGANRPAGLWPVRCSPAVGVPHGSLANPTTAAGGAGLSRPPGLVRSRRTRGPLRRSGPGDPRP